ncbi:unnamed protein product, partial [Ilex paraguariensis]
SVPSPLERFNGPHISCDGAFKERSAAIGVILRDTNDCLLDGIGKCIPAVSSIFAEATA